MFKYKKGYKFKTDVSKDIYTVDESMKRNKVLEQAIKDNIEKYLPPFDEDNDNIYLCHMILDGRAGYRRFSEKHLDSLEKVE